MLNVSRRRVNNDTHAIFVMCHCIVKVVGKGYPLLLMHGGPGAGPALPCCHSSHWLTQFTLIFYDHRCNGRSAGADVTSDDDGKPDGGC